MLRKLLCLVLIAAPVAIFACGDSGGGDEQPDVGSPQAAIVKEAESRVKQAGRDADKLLTARNWIAGQLEGAGSNAQYLEIHLEAAADRCGDAFIDIVGRQKKSTVATATKLAAWAEKAIADLPAEDRLRRRLEKALPDLYVVMLQASPERDDLRLKTGQRKLDVDLNAMLKLPYMDDDEDLDRVDKLIDSLADVIETSPSGDKWIPAGFKDAAKLAAVQKLAEDRKAEFEEKKKDPFFVKAMQVLDETRSALGQKLNTAYEWVGRYHHPYIFVIERDKSWNETDVANEKAEQLQQLITAFKSEYGAMVELPEFEKPFPIVVFKRRTAYSKYVAGSVGISALGHYEHGSGRLMVSEGAGRDTLFHEGTHQLVAYYTQVDTIATFLSRSYWFQEGVAEYFGGTSISLDPETKKWNYDLGVLQVGRLGWWRGNEHKAYSLWDLLGLSFSDREKNRANGDGDLNLMVYSQGWLVIYFLYNFKVDDEGLVVLGSQGQGKYRENFKRYLVGELEGKTGREFFLQCMDMWKDGKVDQEKFDELDREFTAYYEWLNKKTSMKYHVKDRKPIPWDQVTNIRGKKIGDKEDDMLYPADAPEDG